MKTKAARKSLMALLALALGCGGNGQQPIFLVGAAKRDITPTPQTAPPDGQVFLGGYGFGPVRRSTGVLAPIFARAVVVSNGERTVAFATNETQGMFVAYKDGPFGLTHIAEAVEADTEGEILRDHVIINSDHSHAGPDTTGIWGSVPLSYLAFVQEQTVGAIVDAFASRRPARLRVGTADATDLLRSQFSEPPNDQVDGEVRVLLALDHDAGAPQTVLINFAAHATVMGSENLLISADWPGAVAENVEQVLGIDTAVVMVGDIGRTQPERPEAPGAQEKKLAQYAAGVTERALAAIGATQPVTGREVKGTRLFIREPFTNAFLPAEALTSAVARSDQPPWLDNTVVGTWVSVARVGDLFFAGGPGEAYPNIQFVLEERVPATHHFFFGLALDQLGYLISPQEGFPQVRDAYLTEGNDNALFNVSPLIGDHVMCTLLKGARAVDFATGPDPEKCAPYATENNALPP